MRRLKQGPATHGRMPPQSTDNPETGLNRDFFGTLAPGARPDRPASSRRTRCGGGAEPSHASGGRGADTMAL